MEGAAEGAVEGDAEGAVEADVELSAVPASRKATGLLAATGLQHETMDDTSSVDEDILGLYAPAPSAAASGGEEKHFADDLS